jgi:hypothetical protein
MAYRLLYQQEPDSGAVRALFGALDQNHDNAIDFEEFRRIVKILPGLIEIFSSRPKPPASAQVTKKRWYNTFLRRHRQTVKEQGQITMLRDILQVDRISEKSRKASSGPAPSSAFSPQNKPRILQKALSAQLPEKANSSQRPLDDAHCKEESPLLPKTPRRSAETPPSTPKDCCACECRIL